MKAFRQIKVRFVSKELAEKSSATKKSLLQI